MSASTWDDEHGATVRERGSHAGLDWAFASKPIDGETECGDAAVVVHEGSSSMLGVFDGLGHGPGAAHAVAAIRAAGVAALAEVADALHTALRSTRGVVAALLRVDVDAHGDAHLEWLVVGDIEARLYRSAPDAASPVEAASRRGRIVGARMPTLHVTTLTLSPGDTLVCASDGIRTDGWVPPGAEERPLRAALRIGSERRKGTDDSLVFVARCVAVRR